MGETGESSEFELSGGALCLDFANTISDRPRCCEEKLGDYADLLRWSRQAGTLTSAQQRRLELLARDDPRAARHLFRRAVALRETIYRIFTRLAHTETPAAEDLRSLNSTLPEALCRLEIRRRKKGFDWRWGGSPEALDRPLWPVIRSAAELLTSRDASRVRECASETCSWLFIDRSRNHCRRWCDMTTCGNRAKARRHYRRRRRERTAETASVSES